MEKSKKITKIPLKYRRIVLSELKNIGKKIQNQRKKVGLTQEELAEQLDISAMSIQFIEQGRNCPSLPMLLHICVYLRIKIKFI